MKTLKIFVIVLIATFLTSCGNSMMPGSETSDEICRQWGGSLPSRSRADSEQTKSEIQAGYATFALACPNWTHLIP